MLDPRRSRILLLSKNAAPGWSGRHEAASAVGGICVQPHQSGRFQLGHHQPHRLVCDAARSGHGSDVHRAEATEKVERFRLRRPYRSRVLPDGTHEITDASSEIVRQKACLDPGHDFLLPATRLNPASD